VDRLRCWKLDLPRFKSVSALWKEQVSLDEHSPLFNAIRMVHGQNLNGGSSYWCAPDEDRTIPAEMVPPFVPTGMKQARQTTRARIQAGDVGAFETIIVGAR